MDINHPHSIIVLGASAGGVEALSKVMAGMPPVIDAAIFIVIHMSAQSPSLLPAILNRAGALPVRQGAQGARIEAGQVYVARPDNHLMLERGAMRIVHGPRENRYRPSIDVLFRTAAHTYGRRVIGVVLTGALDDGTAGLAAIKRMGGLAIVQDPDEALYPSMPRSALENVAVDHVASLARIPALLADLVAAMPAYGLPGAAPADDPPTAEMEAEMIQTNDLPGKPLALQLPGVPRGALGDPGRRADPLPLPGRPRLLARKHAGRAVRHAGGGALGRPEDAGGKRQPVAPPGGPGR